MSEMPFMQLYVGDYLADTLHMTTEQNGAYLLILMAMWTHDAKVPNDDKKLARIARVSPRRWHLIKNDIIALLDVEGNSLTQKRLKREHQKAVSKRAKRMRSGSLGGTAKSLKTNKPPLANASRLLKHLPEPEPYNNTLSLCAREEGVFLSPDWSPGSDDLASAQKWSVTPDEIDTQAEKFRDYWTGIVGERARSRNWHGRWNRWIETYATGKRKNGKLASQNSAERREDAFERAAREVDAIWNEQEAVDYGPASQNGGTLSDKPDR